MEHISNNTGSHVIKATNFILELKFNTLKALCVEYKSKYEQMQARWQHKYNQQEQKIGKKYTNQIDSLQQQLSNQKLKLEQMEQTINSKEKEITKHQKQIQSLEKQKKTLKNEMKRLKEQNIQKDNDIESLKHEWFIQQREINKLHKQLKLKPVEYKPLLPSPSIMKINKSVSWSTATLSNPTELKFSDMSQNVSTVASVASVPLLPKQNKIKTYKMRNKWTDRKSISTKMQPILLPLSCDKSVSIAASDYTDKAITPFLYVQNSETEISVDVHVSEESSSCH